MVLAAALGACLPVLAAAQTTIDAPDTAATAAAARALSSRISLTGTARSYRVGDSSVTERVVNARYEMFFARYRLRIDASALRYSTRTDLIEGALPISTRLDVALQPGDTLSAYVRTASRPRDLTSTQTASLGVAGTSTVELESASLGSPAVGGARLAMAFPVGELVLATRAAAEIEPRPTGTLPVYWRGTTLRGGLSLTTAGESGSLSGMIDATYSTADSLGGRNLFPGGASVTLQLLGDASVPNPFDPLEDERWPLRALAFYSRPFGDDRADQPTLLIPQGSLIGGVGTLLVPIGAITLAPTLTVLRESSSATSTAGVLRSNISGSAWTAQAGIDVTVPVGARFELTPQLGYTIGNVGAALSQTTFFRRGRGLTQATSFSDAIHGSWVSLQLSAAF
ncbi:hypothetical protein BH09GEM1_BH09GEM1_06370 [soil metagenome]